MNSLKYFILAATISGINCFGYAETPTNVNEYGTSWNWNGGTIELVSPERKAGQQSVLGLALLKQWIMSGSAL